MWASYGHTSIDVTTCLLGLLSGGGRSYPCGQKKSQFHVDLGVPIAIATTKGSCGATILIIPISVLHIITHCSTLVLCASVI